MCCRCKPFPGLDRAKIEAACEQIDRWHERTGRPVLIADTGNWCPTVMNPGRTGSARDQAERGRGYAMLAETFTGRDWCLGWHWCSWLENPHRGFGLKDPWDEPYTELIEVAREINFRLSRQLASPDGDRRSGPVRDAEGAQAKPTKRED